MILNLTNDAILRHKINKRVKMLSRLSIYPFLIQLCQTFTLYWLSMHLHSLINAIPCFLPFLYFCVTDKCAISCNNTLFSFSSSPTNSFIYLDGFILKMPILVYFKLKLSDNGFKAFAKKAHLGTLQFSLKIQLVVFVKPQS